MVLCGFSDAVRRIGIGKPIRSYLICNPSTQKWIALPLAPCNFGCGPLVARLVCEPSISTNLDLGLGDDGQSPTFIDASSKLLIPGSSPAVTVSQDALYLIPNNDTDDEGDDLALFIWKLDVQEDGKHSWRKQREVLVKKMKKKKKKKNKCWCGCERKVVAENAMLWLNLFFIHLIRRLSCSSVLLVRLVYIPWLCQWKKKEKWSYWGKLEKVDGDRFLDYYHKVFEPTLSCWPTPIPTYKELPEHIRWDVAAKS
ncbi:hypothetical protein LINGRAHAP2_LOCUS28959 [Linum grandiflorum]